jgi:excisionase family DNA binding protein
MMSDQQSEKARRLQEESPLLSIRELASMLQVSTRTISRMKSEGSLPKPIFIGRLVRWKRKDIEAWLN